MFRGDECVSLGWCFWHRACYGCLMCGDRRVVEGTRVEQLFEKDGDTEGSNAGTVAESRAGREVEKIPLCKRCVEDVGRDSMDEGHLIPMALGRVEKFDGGLSRRRWEARQQTREPRASSVPVHPPSPPVEGNRRSSSPIYVSSHDPLGEPAFRRSSTKPIPKWMQYLPSQRQVTRDCPSPRPASVLNSYFAPQDTTALEPGDDRRMSPSPPPVPPHATPVRTCPPTYTPVQKSRPFALVAEEPVQRPSSAKVGAGRATTQKQVRFTTSTPDSTESTAFSRRGKAPSESSDYLDKYYVQPPAAGVSVKSSIRDAPLSSDARYARAVSPFFRRNTNTATVSSDSAPSGVAGSHDDVSSLLSVGSMERKYGPRHARSALELASRYESAQDRKDSEKSHVRHHEYPSSCPRTLHGVGADRVVDAVGAGSIQRRPLTFQDQLKRVFGFS